MENSDKLTLKVLLGMFCADIDIFLLREQDQETDKEKVYSKDEIREQLTKSLHKFYTVLSEKGLNMNETLLFEVPLFSPKYLKLMKEKETLINQNNG